MPASRAPQSGFGLIDVLIATLVFGVTTVAVMGVATLGVRLSADGERQTVALNLAREKIEYVRTLAYEQIGVQPAGVLLAQEIVTRNQQPYQVVTDVVYVDDPKTPGITQDFKKVRVAVQWTAPSNQTRAAVLVTLVSKAGAGLAGTPAPSPAASPGVGICTPLVAGTGTAVHQYYDNNTWKNVGPPNNTEKIIKLYYAAGSNQYLFAGTDQGRVWAYLTGSQNGSYWYDMGTPSAAGPITGLTGAPGALVAVSSGDHVFVKATSPTGPWIDWGIVAPSTSVDVLSGNSNALYAGTGDGRIIKYGGSPSSWTPVGLPIGSPITALNALSSSTDPFFGAANGAMYEIKSTGFFPLGSFNNPIKAIKVDSNVYVGTKDSGGNAAVYSSNAAAFSGWSLVSGGPLPNSTEVSDLALTSSPYTVHAAADFGNNGTVYGYKAVTTSWLPLARVGTTTGVVDALELYQASACIQ